MDDHEKIYKAFCRDRFEEILTEIRELRDRLFVDNGGESIQSRLNRHEKYIKIWNWFLVIMGGAIILGMVSRFFE